MSAPWLLVKCSPKLGQPVLELVVANSHPRCRRRETPPGTSSSAYCDCLGLPTTAHVPPLKAGRRIVTPAGAPLKVTERRGAMTLTNSKRPMDRRWVRGRHGPSFAAAGYALFDPGSTGTPPGTSTSTMFTFDTSVLSF